MSRRSSAVLGLVPVVALVAAVLAGCSSGGDTGAGTTSGGGSISLVASTDVWGSVAKAVAGDDVRITSIITDPDADPHSYEANAQVKLELSEADVVVENGGGYDDFVDTMVGSLDHAPATINAVRVSGRQAVNGELNEHVWYDLPTVAKVAAQIAAELGKVDPSKAGEFTANQQAFDGRLDALEATETAIRTAVPADTAYAVTEPVPVYLLDACGLVNRTPAEFSEAIEEGTDVSPSVLDETLKLFTGRQVRLLAYNEQTSGPETEKVLAAARSNNVAVVPVTETLPSGKDYLTWMTDNLAAVRTAVGA